MLPLRVTATKEQIFGKEKCLVSIKLHLLLDYKRKRTICFFKEPSEHSIFDKTLSIDVEGLEFNIKKLYKNIHPVSGFIAGEPNSLVQGYLIKKKFYGTIRMYDKFRLYHIVFYVEPLSNVALYSGRYSTQEVPHRENDNAVMFEYVSHSDTSEWLNCDSALNPTKLPASEVTTNDTIVTLNPSSTTSSDSKSKKTTQRSSNAANASITSDSGSFRTSPISKASDVSETASISNTSVITAASNTSATSKITAVSNTSATSETTPVSKTLETSVTSTTSQTSATSISSSTQTTSQTSSSPLSTVTTTPIVHSTDPFSVRSTAPIVPTPPHSTDLISVKTMTVPHSTDATTEFKTGSPIHSTILTQAGSQSPFHSTIITQAGSQSPFHSTTLTPAGSQSPFHSTTLTQAGSQSPFHSTTLTQAGSQSPFHSTTQVDLRHSTEATTPTRPTFSYYNHSTEATDWVFNLGSHSTEPSTQPTFGTFHSTMVTTQLAFSHSTDSVSLIYHSTEMTSPPTTTRPIHSTDFNDESTSTTVSTLNPLFSTDVVNTSSTSGSTSTTITAIGSWVLNYEEPQERDQINVLSQDCKRMDFSIEKRNATFYRLKAKANYTMVEALVNKYILTEPESGGDMVFYVEEANDTHLLVKGVDSTETASLKPIRCSKIQYKRIDTNVSVVEGFVWENYNQATIIVETVNATKKFDPKYVSFCVYNNKKTYLILNVTGTLVTLVRYDCPFSPFIASTDITTTPHFYHSTESDKLAVKVGESVTIVFPEDTWPSETAKLLSKDTEKVMVEIKTTLDPKANGTKVTIQDSSGKILEEGTIVNIAGKKVTIVFIDRQAIIAAGPPHSTSQYNQQHSTEQTTVPSTTTKGSTSTKQPIISHSTLVMTSPMHSTMVTKLTTKFLPTFTTTTASTRLVTHSTDKFTEPYHSTSVATRTTEGTTVLTTTETTTSTGRVTWSHSTEPTVPLVHSTDAGTLSTKIITTPAPTTVTTTTSTTTKNTTTSTTSTTTTKPPTTMSTKKPVTVKVEKPVHSTDVSTPLIHSTDITRTTVTTTVTTLPTTTSTVPTTSTSTLTTTTSAKTTSGIKTVTPTENSSFNKNVTSIADSSSNKNVTSSADSSSNQNVTSSADSGGNKNVTSSADSGGNKNVTSSADSGGNKNVTSSDDSSGNKNVTSSANSGGNKNVTSSADSSVNRNGTTGAESGSNKNVTAGADSGSDKNVSTGTDSSFNKNFTTAAANARPTTTMPIDETWPEKGTPVFLINVDCSDITATVVERNETHLKLEVKPPRNDLLKLIGQYTFGTNANGIQISVKILEATSSVLTVKNVPKDSWEQNEAKPFKCSWLTCTLPGDNTTKVVKGEVIRNSDGTVSIDTKKGVKKTIKEGDELICDGRPVEVIKVEPNGTVVITRPQPLTTMQSTPYHSTDPLETTTVFNDHSTDVSTPSALTFLFFPSTELYDPLHSTDIISTSHHPDVFSTEVFTTVSPVTQISDKTTTRRETSTVKPTSGTTTPASTTRSSGTSRNTTIPFIPSSEIATFSTEVTMVTGNSFTAGNSFTSGNSLTTPTPKKTRITEQEFTTSRIITTKKKDQLPLTKFPEFKGSTEVTNSTTPGPPTLPTNFILSTEVLTTGGTTGGNTGGTTGKKITKATAIPANRTTNSKPTTEKPKSPEVGNVSALEHSTEPPTGWEMFHSTEVSSTPIQPGRRKRDLLFNFNTFFGENALETELEDDVDERLDFSGGVSSSDIFDLRMDRSSICQLCIWIQPHFAEIFGLGGGLLHGIAEIVDIIKFTDWIFRAIDFNQDGLAENIGFTIKRILLKDSIKLTGTERKRREFFPKEQFLFDDYYDNVYDDESNETTFDPRGLCSGNNLGLISGYLHSHKLTKYDVFRGVMHALGHLFGAPHDSISEGDCQDFQMYNFLNPFLLHPIQQTNTGVRPNSFRYSPCAKDEITSFLSSNGPSCLKTAGSEFCGNGVQDEGEDCDCGSPWQCHLSYPCCGEKDVFMGFNVSLEIWPQKYTSVQFSCKKIVSTT
ncbi:unnamed protein product [Allacma fusca]|uniref:Peptidase M12B domain-containing protein n=1 Tax=Allacma fusca TaxID=39272 RepID=A0A8J2KPC8_9HEXA|nr:unnamed protein product [Allacma fusca]